MSNKVKQPTANTKQPIEEKTEINKTENVNNESSIQQQPQTQEKGSKSNLKDIASTRQYLEATVVNVVMQGMAELSKERPEKPLEFLGNFLISKSKDLEG